MHSVARRACLSIATTEQTAVKLRRLGAKNVVVHPQFGMTDRELRYFRDFPIRNSTPFRLVSIGRLIHWKGFHLSLRAFASFHRYHPESEYWILSAGPESRNLKALAAQLGIQDSVLFWGGFPTIREVHQKLAQCDVLVHPALHEAFGNVCLEAMAAGRPVVCLDLGGPALQVTPDTGIEVPAAKCDQVITDLSAAFSRLADDPAFRITLGRAARERVADHFMWDKYGEWMNRIYCSAQTSQYTMPAVPAF
jgi:glycosyltransferase involved in cell wall biosynthesis